MSVGWVGMIVVTGADFRRFVSKQQECWWYCRFSAAVRQKKLLCYCVVAVHYIRMHGGYFRLNNQSPSCVSELQKTMVYVETNMKWWFLHTGVPQSKFFDVQGVYIKLEFLAGSFYQLNPRELSQQSVCRQQPSMNWICLELSTGC